MATPVIRGLVEMVYQLGKRCGSDADYSQVGTYH